MNFNNATIIYNQIKLLKEIYPSFDFWFWNKVIPEINDGYRKISCYGKINDILGISIMKKTKEERKLSTLFIFPQYENRGLGIKLFEESFEYLETEKPYLTISEEKYYKYKKICNYYGFEITSIKDGLYIPNKKELIFNEFNRRF